LVPLAAPIADLPALAPERGGSTTIGRNSSLSQQEVVGEDFHPGLRELGEFRRQGFRSRRQDAVLHRNRVSRLPALGSRRAGSWQKATSPIPKMLRDSIRR